MGKGFKPQITPDWHGSERYKNEVSLPLFFLSAKSVLLLLLTYRRDETMVKPPAAGLDRIF